MKPPSAQTASSRATPAAAGPAIRVFFQHWSPRLILIAAGIAWAVRLSQLHWSLWDVAVALGIALYWPLNEWLIHVLLLHFKPRRWHGVTLDFAVARDHRRHHADPWNLKLVFVPLHVFPAALAAIVIAGWVLMPTPELAASFVAVYLSFSLHYEWSHNLAHINWHPPLKYYQQRIREHRLHHFRNHNFWWGVSMGSADRWLRTAPEPEVIDRSDRDLFAHGQKST